MKLMILIVAALANVVNASDLKVSQYPTGITKELHEKIESSLKWLSEHQSVDGSFDEGFESSLFVSQYSVTTTSLVGLAFLSHGDTLSTGVYSKTVNKVAHYLMRRAYKDGLYNNGTNADRPIYCHCYAVLFLSEALGTEVDEAAADLMKAQLAKAVKLIEDSQSVRGGWYYGLDGTHGFADEGSTTVCAVQALRAAKNAGIKVSVTAINRGIDYIIDCQQPDGSISYSFDSKGDGTSSNGRPILTGAAVCVMYNAGVYKAAPNDPIGGRRQTSLKRSLRYVRDMYKDASVHHFWCYAQLYYSQMAWLSGDEYWEPFFEYYIKTMYDDKYYNKKDGYWVGDSALTDRYFGTAIALIVLQIPYKYLPILQR